MTSGRATHKFYAPKFVVQHLDKSFMLEIVDGSKNVNERLPVGSRDLVHDSAPLSAGALVNLLDLAPKTNFFQFYL